MNNLEYYCRNAVVTEQDLNVLTIGELEKVVSVREATVGERKVPAIQRHRKPVSQRSGEGFSSRTERGAHCARCSTDLRLDKQKTLSQNGTFNKAVYLKVKRVEWESNG